MEHWGGNGTYPLNRSYTYGFQEQERQEETGWNSFKWRNYDASLGRCFNVDPLSEAYGNQSHYNFSENRVIDAREIEGLESQVINEQGDMIVNGYSLSHTEYTKGTDGTININEIVVGNRQPNISYNFSSSQLNNVPTMGPTPHTFGNTLQDFRNSQAPGGIVGDF